VERAVFFRQLTGNSLRGIRYGVAGGAAGRFRPS
jgi:hypothetical protein